MRYASTIFALGIALALFGSSHALARTTHHRVSTGHRILGNRRTRVYFVSQNPRPLPSTRDRIYFLTVDQARAAGYHPDRVPVSPQLTWQGTKRQLPSIGKEHIPPPPPQGTNQPLAPPRAQQPPVTPTNPMPND